MNLPPEALTAAEYWEQMKGRTRPLTQEPIRKRLRTEKPSTPSGEEQSLVDRFIIAEVEQ